MSLRLYDTNSFLREFSATVTACVPGKKGYGIVLDQTAFFPEGGGQSGDIGYLNNVAVLDTQESEGEIFHLTAEPMECGTEVLGHLQWDERFRKMQNHSGEHIVSGLIHRLFGLENVGFHLGKDDVTMDYNGELTREELDRVEWLANEAIYKNIPIRTEYPAPEKLPMMEYRSKLELTENVRIVTIEGYDCCACCAPHVATTGQIGVIKLLDFMRYKGGIRVHLHCGGDALLDYRGKYTQVLQISQMLSAKQEEIAQAVERLREECEAQKQSVNQWKRAWTEENLKTVPESVTKPTLLFENGLDSNTLRLWVNGALQKVNGLCGAFSGEDGKGYQYIVAFAKGGMKNFGKQMNQALSGRGGGGDTMLQGSVSATRAEIEDFFASVCLP